MNNISAARKLAIYEGRVVLRPPSSRHRTDGFDSSWERLLADYLTERKIRWRKCDQHFDYRHKGKDRLYKPDFYLPNYKVYVEVKGWTTSTDISKWSYLIRKHRLLVVTYRDIALLRRGLLKLRSHLSLFENTQLIYEGRAESIQRLRSLFGEREYTPNGHRTPIRDLPSSLQKERLSSLKRSLSDAGKKGSSTRNNQVQELLKQQDLQLKEIWIDLGYVNHPKFGWKLRLSEYLEITKAQLRGFLKRNPDYLELLTET